MTRGHPSHASPLCTDKNTAINNNRMILKIGKKNVRQMNLDVDREDKDSSSNEDHETPAKAINRKAKDKERVIESEDEASEIGRGSAIPNSTVILTYEPLKTIC